MQGEECRRDRTAIPKIPKKLLGYLSKWVDCTGWRAAASKSRSASIRTIELPLPAILQFCRRPAWTARSVAGKASQLEHFDYVQRGHLHSNRKNSRWSGSARPSRRSGRTGAIRIGQPGRRIGRYRLGLPTRRMTRLQGRFLVATKTTLPRCTPRSTTSTRWTSCAQFIQKTLCEKENLLADQFAMTEFPLIRGGELCGLHFSLRWSPQRALGSDLGG